MEDKVELIIEYSDFANGLTDILLPEMVYEDAILEYNDRLEFGIPITMIYNGKYLELGFADIIEHNKLFIEIFNKELIDIFDKGINGYKIKFNISDSRIIYLPSKNVSVYNYIKFEKIYILPTFKDEKDNDIIDNISDDSIDCDSIDAEIVEE